MVAKLGSTNMQELTSPEQKLRVNRRELFAQECASGKSQTAAYKLAYPSSLKWEAAAVANRASDTARRPEVKARIAYLRSKLDRGVDHLFSITKAEAAAMVLQDAVEVLRADPADLVTHRRLNCRYCHGTNHAYRWRDETEFWGELARVANVIEGWSAKRGRPPELPTDEGGYGWRRTHPPAADCPQCEGEGISDVLVADVRTVAGASRRAYAGLEVKKDGSIKLLQRDKEAARAMLAKFAGVADDSLKVSGVLGLTPVQQMSPEEAAAVARALENKI